MREVKTGSQCVRCLAGRMQTRSVYSTSAWHTRYLACDQCGCKAQQIVPADAVRRRKPVKQKTVGR